MWSSPPSPLPVVFAALQAQANARALRPPPAFPRRLPARDIGSAMRMAPAPARAVALSSLVALAAAMAPAVAIAGDARWATVTGTVERNQLDCHRDGPCQLHVRSGGERWLLVYHPGEGESPGLRDDLARLGHGIAPGSQVSATGQPSVAGALKVLHLLGDQAGLRVLRRP